MVNGWGGRREPGPGKKLGRPSSRMTSDEFEALVQEQHGMCALCLEPGSAGGLIADTDELRKKTRGLVHPRCKKFLDLGHDNPLRFQMAFTYLVQHAVGAVPKSLPIARAVSDSSVFVGDGSS